MKTKRYIKPVLIVYVVLMTVLLAMNFMYFFFIGAFSIRDAMPALFVPFLALS